MKNLLVPTLIGVSVLTAWPLRPAGAQMPFTSSPMTNGGIYGRSAFSPSAANPPVAPAAAPGMAYGMPAGGYPVAALSSELIDPDHKLARGDRLSYRVVEDRDDKVIPLVVTDSGEVDIPLINRVKAANKTVGQLTSDIKSRLEQEYYYHATVVLGLDAVASRPNRGTIYVKGQVKIVGPQELPLDAPMTVSEAITKAGGFGEFPKDDKVRVVRKGGPPKGYIIDVRAVDRGDTAKDFVLQPGDQVVVDEARIGIRF